MVDPPHDTSEAAPLRMGVGKSKRKALSASWGELGRQNGGPGAHSNDDNEDADLSDAAEGSSLPDTFSIPLIKKERPNGVPLLVANMPSQVLGSMNDSDRFRADINGRAEDLGVSSAAYRAVPIEAFGAALLRGMGWAGPQAEGGQEGKEKEKEQKPLVAREPRLGLGAIAKPPDEKAKGASKQAQREAWKERADEQASAAAARLAVGALVWLREARFAGRRACVINVTSVPGLDRVAVRLESDGAETDVRRADAVLLSEQELRDRPYSGDIAVGPAAAQAVVGVALHGSKRKPEDGEAAGQQKRARVECAEGKGEDKDRRREREKEKEKEKEAQWLRPGIRVRVVSKKVGGSAAYLQKGHVVDVYGEGVCSVQLQAAGALLEGVRQRHLETVLPALGGGCVLLAGEHRGKLARLLEKRKEQQAAVVELQEELDVLVVAMDLVAAVAGSG